MKKKTIRIAAILCMLSMAAGAFIIYRMYNKPHRSAVTATAVAINATQLAAAFEQDEAAANKKYLGNVVQVSGTVSEVSVNQQHKPILVLTGTGISGVQCTLLEATGGIKKGDLLTIKGFCNGFLTDVIIDRCIIYH